MGTAEQMCVWIDIIWQDKQICSYNLFMYRKALMQEAKLHVQDWLEIVEVFFEHVDVELMKQALLVA